MLSRFMYTGSRAVSAAAGGVMSSSQTAPPRIATRRSHVEVAYTGEPAAVSTDRDAPSTAAVPPLAASPPSLKRKQMSSKDVVGDGAQTPRAGAGAGAEGTDGSVDESPRATKVVRSQSLPVERRKGAIAPPEHWRQQYDNIVAMRAKRDAPVDTIGCEVGTTCF